MTKLSAGIQEALIALLCHDNAAAKVVSALVPAKAFDTYFRDIAGEVEEYLAKYKKAPGEHTLDIIDTLKHRHPDAAEIFDRLYRSIEQVKDSVNREFVITRAGFFARRQRMKSTMAKMLDLLGKDTDASVDEAEALMAVGSKSTADIFNPGLLLNDPIQALRFLQRQDDYFETGISVLDKYNLGPVRKGLHLFVAAPNKGKSWWEIHLGKMGLRMGRRVCHITCEMSEEKVAMRYLQSIFSISKREAKVVYSRLIKEKGQFVGLDEREMPTRPHMGLDDITHFLLKKVRGLANRQRLFIKEFPTGGLTVSQLKAYLDTMEGRHNFMPDLLIIDYPDIMRIDAKNRRAETGTLYQELRGLGVERNLAVSCPTQANRDAERSVKGLIQGKNLSEDYSKFGIADTIITYNQTDEEYGMGLARLYNLKARDDVKNTTLLISQAYTVGQFCIDSVRMKNTDPKYWSQVGEPDDGATEDDDADD